MPDTFIEKFLVAFDDSYFPADFQQDYEIMECLARNEMGETLLVKDRRTGDLRVAKCCADQTHLSRAAESSLLKNVRHAGLPAYIGEYQNENMLCVVRAYVEGTPLDQLVSAFPLTSGQSVDIILQLCDILTCLHTQNPPVIHRDIKPQNIIVDRRGRVTLIDFGISRAYNESAPADTLCFGTRHYAAPEQYGFSQTDPRSDIYSLGVLLCWLLTGEVQVEQGKKAVTDRRLLNVVSKCTAFDPRDRFKNAAQVKDALTGLPRRRRRAAMAALAVLLIVSAGALIHRSASGVHFKEPLIEEAVRLSLGLDQDAPLTEKHLLTVDQIFILGNQAAPDYAAFNDLVQEFTHGSGALPRGEIVSLDDLTQLKNIRNISLAFQTFNDLTPLAELPYLEVLDIRNNPQVNDLAPLAHSETLTSLTIFDTSVADLSVLRSCPRLSSVDAGYTLIDSMDDLQGLDALRILMIRKAPLQSLQGIASCPQLEQIYLAQTSLGDLSPLLELPNLKLVEVSQDMRSIVEALAGQAHFEIVYQ